MSVVRSPYVRFVLPQVLIALWGTSWLWQASLALGDGRWPFLFLFWLNLMGVALSAWPTLLGFGVWLVRWAGRVGVDYPQPTGRGRTAVVMPIHNEDPARVFAAMEVMAQACATAQVPGVTFYVLSDSTDPALIRAEADHAAALAARDGGVIYRHRTENTGRKVGNLEDFCERWGDQHDYMLVLDADSLMTAQAISRLIGLMDADPKAGILQSVPYVVNRETLFARWQQFAARLYSPLWALGNDAWQGDAGNYWGHNAIIRIVPFRQHCTLPVLPGRPPFGGEILCHDVVEAGLMRRAGWGVRMVPDLAGSYEEMPTNLLDFYGRERRWCQGNLQHAKLLAWPGLRPASRLHLVVGILYYVFSFAWIALLLATLCFAPRGLAAIALPSVLLIWGVGALPKALSALVACLDPDVEQNWGGRGRLWASWAVDQVLTFLGSPIGILYDAFFVTMVLMGWNVRWDTQERADRGLRWGEAMRALRWHGAVGLVGVVAAMLFNPWLLLGAVPGLIGLFLAVPYAVLGSEVWAGQWARRWGLFLTPDELCPASELVRYRASVHSVPAGEKTAPVR